MWQVRVWDVNTLKCLATLTGHSGAVRALAASSKRVFSGSDDTTIKVCLLDAYPRDNVAMEPELCMCALIMLLVTR